MSQLRARFRFLLLPAIAAASILLAAELSARLPAASFVILLFALIWGGRVAAGAWWGFERWEAPSIRRLFREAIGPFALSAPKPETR